MQNYQYDISSDYEISVKERKAGDTKKATTEHTVDPDSLATFKINFDEDELAARNALKLPYERCEIHFDSRFQLGFNFFFHFLRRTSEVPTPVDPQIHYNPDSDDDFDYEDPDEDLYI